MLDDDDLLTATILAPTPGGSGPVGCIATLIGLAIVIAIAVVVSQNKEECGKRTCEAGSKPMLLKGECLCVSQAKP
jgi:hypothetical protein